jgi:hypothetical protein
VETDLPRIVNFVFSVAYGKEATGNADGWRCDNQTTIERYAESISELLAAVNESEFQTPEELSAFKRPFEQHCAIISAMTPADRSDNSRATD